MRSKDESLREQLSAHSWCESTHRKSKVVPGQQLFESDTRIICPGCRNTRWWGMYKRHYCKACDIWVMVEWANVTMYLYVSKTKEGLGERRFEKNYRKLRQAAEAKRQAGSVPEDTEGEQP